MEVTCGNCGKNLKIPDDKIPREKIVRVTCPLCRHKITLDGRKSPGEAGDDLLDPSLDLGEAAEDATEVGASLGFFDDETRLALILDHDEERKEKVRGEVEALGFLYVESPTTRDAIGKMRYHHFDLILLAEGFDGQPLEYSPIINSLNHTPMASRRKIFLTLIGDQFQTLDHMTAFAMSANLVINPKDVNNAAKVIKNGLAENERFYKVYMDCLRETGKG